MSKKIDFTFFVIIFIFSTVNRLLAVPTPIDQVKIFCRQYFPALTGQYFPALTGQTRYIILNRQAFALHNRGGGGD